MREIMNAQMSGYQRVKGKKEKVKERNVLICRLIVNRYSLRRRVVGGELSSYYRSYSHLAVFDLRRESCHRSHTTMRKSVQETTRVSARTSPRVSANGRTIPKSPKGSRSKTGATSSQQNRRYDSGRSDKT